MTMHRPFEYYFARGLICLILGASLCESAGARNGPACPRRRKNPSGFHRAIGTGPPAGTPNPAAQPAPPDDTNNNQPPQQAAPDYSTTIPQKQLRPPRKQSGVNRSRQRLQLTTPQPNAANAPVSPEPWPAPSQNEFADRDWKLQKISPDYDWTRHFRIGMLAGFNIKANMTMSGTFAIPLPVRRESMMTVMC